MSAPLSPRGASPHGSRRLSRSRAHEPPNDAAESGAAARAQNAERALRSERRVRRRLEATCVDLESELAALLAARSRADADATLFAELCDAAADADGASGLSRLGGEPPPTLGAAARAVDASPAGATTATAMVAVKVEGHTPACPLDLDVRDARF